MAESALVTAILLGAANLQLTMPGQDDVADILNAWVVLHNTRGTKGLFYLRLYFGLGIFHEYCRLGVRLGHLDLTLFEAGKHVVGNDDGLELALCEVTVLPCKHVHLPLVVAQLANVRLHTFVAYNGVLDTHKPYAVE